MRIIAQAPRRIGDAHAIEQAFGLGLGSRAFQAAMQAQRLADLAADTQNRIETGGRVLEDHGDTPAAQGFQHGTRGAHHLAAVQHDAAPDAGRSGQQAQGRQPGDAFARTGFADQANRLAGTDIEIDAVQGADAAAALGKIDRQVADFHELVHRRMPSAVLENERRRE